MKENSEKRQLNIVVPENYEGGTIDVVIREGEATKLINPKPLKKVALCGIIDSPLRWLEKRVAEIDQINQKRCFVLVNRENLSIALVIDENNEDGAGIIGKLELDPVFVSFGINSGKTWTPTKLGEFFKMNRAYFPDKDINMTLVSDLRGFRATVEQNLAKEKEQSGSFNESFSAVVNSNLPKSFNLNLPIFKGSERELIEVEVYADVDGRDVSLTLVSAGANEVITEQRDNKIEEVLKGIRSLAPDIAIIEQ